MWFPWPILTQIIRKQKRRTNYPELTLIIYHRMCIASLRRPLITEQSCQESRVIMAILYHTNSEDLQNSSPHSTTYTLLLNLPANLLLIHQLPRRRCSSQWWQQHLQWPLNRQTRTSTSSAPPHTPGIPTILYPTVLHYDYDKSVLTTQFSRNAPTNY